MIEVRNISKKYGKQEILKDVSISAAPGEMVAIVGRNGCGKSTLLQILAGILPADSGLITYFGNDPVKNPATFKNMCGYVPQTNPLIEELSVSDNLKLFGASVDITKNDLFKDFELGEIIKKPVSKLSGGMKRRVAIACTVYHMPKVLFMDEPTTNLDIYYKKTIHTWMKMYQKTGGILLMVTHDESEIEMCDKRILISDGISSEYKGNM